MKEAVLSTVFVLRPMYSLDVFTWYEVWIWVMLTCDGQPIRLLIPSDENVNSGLPS